ncbi:FAD-dependent oxidoreductase [Bradyrhizobium sp. Gha]|uniref:FAD-dependent oxidoreductase n=1 Tax=Bradyrhizobium sp. Gha TaxID=1855318 RepID=UPI0008E3AB5D|nr:FAD-dependent oxidoreductase [Bradyrhizobium sp. Gha]SFI94556.1 Succinate dehydrogenase/fumarate reductase, flavoprotein subunit [Bradyrhizobium sp. Gha]
MREVDCDVLVVGSGAAGLTAAITAEEAGLRVLLVEKTEFIGGTTAFSAGVIWIPNNGPARKLGVIDTPEDAIRYLRSETGNKIDEQKAAAYIHYAPEMLDFMQSKSQAQFDALPSMPDYHPDYPGGSKGGRSLRPRVFDGRRLGESFASLRPPIKTMTIFGGMMVGSADLPHLYNFKRSLSSFSHAAKMFARYCLDRISHDRGTRLTNGNALIAALLLTANDRKIAIWRSSPVSALISDNGAVHGAIVSKDGEDIRVVAKKAVILATGGFPADEEQRQELDRDVHNGIRFRSLAPTTNTGDGLRLARSMGAGTDFDVHHYAAWTPVSEVPQPDGSTIGFPHFNDRAKPGFIVVDKRGRRFCNETVSYHDFVPLMLDACRNDETVEAFIIADHQSVRRWGMGAAPPSPLSIAPFLRSGYLKRASTVEGLAKLLGMDPGGLVDTLSEFNRSAELGQDPAFGRGNDAYQRIHGAMHERGYHPNIAPIKSPPYYALRIIPGDIGTFAGIRTNEKAEVISKEGAPIPNLYAVGNDSGSVMRGTYPGAGVTLGPAMTFAYIAASRIAGRDGFRP